MKKFILITPLALSLSMFFLNANLEAAGCRSHKSIKTECSLSEDNCDNNESDKKIKKVEG